MTAIFRVDGAPLTSPDIDVYAYGFARAINDAGRYAREAGNRALDATGYLRNVRRLATMEQPPEAALRTAIAALDCARADLETALARITAHAE